MNIKKFTAFTLTAVLAAAGFTGCSKNYETVVTVDGTAFSPSMYLCAQYQAYNAALSYVADAANVLDVTIEEMPAEEWIHAETIKNLQVYVWTEKTYEEMGLEIDAEEQAYIDYQIEYYWPYVEAAYTENGIGEETYRKFVTLDYKSNELFSKIYEDGSEKAPTEDEYIAYMNENYARIKGFYMPMTDAEGNEMDENQLKSVAELCDAAVAELNAGADLEEVCGKYKSKAAIIASDKTAYEDGSQYVTDTYIGKNSESFAQIVSANAFAMEENGEYTYDETNNRYLIYQRVPNFGDGSELSDIKANLLSEMKGEEHLAYVESETSKLDVAENTGAVKYYSVNKIK